MMFRHAPIDEIERHEIEPKQPHQIQGDQPIDPNQRRRGEQERHDRQDQLDDRAQSERSKSRSRRKKILENQRIL